MILGPEERTQYSAHSRSHDKNEMKKIAQVVKFSLLNDHLRIEFSYMQGRCEKTRQIKLHVVNN